ncbi:MAG TPA: alpha/beta hydrolase [Acidimicrobiales bacterium]|nr:alpha/beta hydrolase [Acidimicrobiales bacterium]
MELRPGTIEANGLRFGFLEAGPADGPLALCLHGFPDSAWSWRHLLPALGEAGFHGVAPFLRGYAPTEVPAEPRYQSGALVADACALHQAFGADAGAVLVGHDWGALATYGAAALAPGRWRRAVAMAVPPAPALAGAFLSYRQLRRSWYMFFFQVPLADAAVALDDLRFLDQLWADWSPGYDAGDDLPRVKECLREPANLQAALGYYRALFDPSRQAPELAAEQAATQAPTPQPTLYLHGTDDGCMGAEVVAEKAVLSHLGPGSRVELVDGSGHFLHLERPEEVNRRVVDFVTGS